MLKVTGVRSESSVSSCNHEMWPFSRHFIKVLVYNIAKHLERIFLELLTVLYEKRLPVQTWMHMFCYRVLQSSCSRVRIKQYFTSTVSGMAH